MSARRFFSAETEAQAVLEAAGELGLSPGELAYRRVDKKHGALRRSRIVIEVDPLRPRREPPALVPPTMPASPAPRAPSPPAGIDARPLSGRRESPLREPEVEGRWVAPPVDPRTGGLAGALAGAAALAELAGLRLDARAVAAQGEEGEELRVDVQGPDGSLLLAHQGEVLRSSEYLLRRMVRELPEGGLVLDSGGYRAERQAMLERRAAAAADEVRRSGQPVILEPLPAAERRIVHLAIQREEAVASQSEGDGDLRRVRVIPRPAG
jgi:spoIIIJ-associated protein